MNGLKIGALVLIAAILAGCVAETPENPASSPLAIRPEGAIAIDHMANATGCSGTYVSLPISWLSAQAIVGDEYTPAETATGVARAFIEALECQKVARLGKDVGAGTFFTVEILIEPPDSNPPPEGFDSAYLLEFGTDNGAFAEFWAPLTKHQKVATTSHAGERGPAPVDSWSGKIESDGLQVYSWHGAAPKDVIDEGFQVRYYTRDGPTDHVLDASFVLTTGNIDSAAIFTASSSSVLAAAIGPGGISAVTIGRIYDERISFESINGD